MFFQFVSYQLYVTTIKFKIDCLVFKYESLEMMDMCLKENKISDQMEEMVPPKQSVYFYKRHVLISLFVVHLW
jgi:hypothetical protein